MRNFILNSIPPVEDGDIILNNLTPEILKIKNTIKWYGYFGMRRNYGIGVAQMFNTSPNVIPTRTINSGFGYKYSNIDYALKDLSKNIGVLKSLKRRIRALLIWGMSHQRMVENWWYSKGQFRQPAENVVIQQFPMRPQNFVKRENEKDSQENTSHAENVKSTTYHA